MFNNESTCDSEFIKIRYYLCDAQKLYLKNTIKLWKVLWKTQTQNGYK